MLTGTIQSKQRKINYGYVTVFNKGDKPGGSKYKISKNFTGYY
jgi:hypothetical protein